MSLKWDITTIGHHETKCWTETEDGKALNFVTAALLWACVSVDMQEITIANYGEFYTRYLMICAANGGKLVFPSSTSSPIFPDADDDNLVFPGLTLQDIKDHAGLWTNVSTKTRAQFNEKVAGVLRDQAERAFRYEEKGIEGGE